VNLKIYTTAAMAVCAAMPLLAQAGRQRPAQAIALSAPTVFLDASRFGSPVPLDKDWRVGITANPQAAMPDFDDSIWAVRDAQKSIADVDDQEANSELAGNGTPGQRPFVWFRLHVKLAPTTVLSPCSSIYPYRKASPWSSLRQGRG
jgi:hypothetical protein